MSDAVKLNIRPPPHANFVRDFPGIPANASGSRPRACVQGSVEVRPRGRGIKALSLFLEVRKLEIISDGGKATSRYRENLGERAIALWHASGHTGKKAAGGAGESGYETLEKGDFPFCVPLLETLPSSVLIDRKTGIGIQYELVVVLLAKPKTGFFQHSSKTPEHITEHAAFVLEKHELHAGWPIYEYKAQLEDRRSMQNKLYMSIKRDTVVYGPGDTIAVQVKLRSQRIDPVKISRIELTLKEVITFKGDVKDPNSAGQQQMVNIVEAKHWINKPIYPGDEGNFIVQGHVPKDHSRVTITAAKHISIVYHLGLRTVVEKDKHTTAPIDDLVIDFLPTMMDSLSKEQGDAEIEQILRTGGGVPDFLAAQGPLPLRASTLAGDTGSSSGTPSSLPYDVPPKTPDGPVSGFRLVNGSPSPPLASANSSLARSGPQQSFGHASARSMSSDGTNGTFAMAQQSAMLVEHARQRAVASRQVEEQPPAISAESLRADVAYPSAEQEKAALARDREQLSQQLAALNPSSPTPITASPKSAPQSSPQPPPPQPAYLTAEEEKKRLQENLAGLSPPPAPVPVAAVKSPPVAQQSFPSAEEEKRRMNDNMAAFMPKPAPMPAPIAAQAANTRSPPIAQSAFPTAEEEKRRMNDNMAALSSPPVAGPVANPAAASQRSPPVAQGAFLSAEEEKRRLYDDAVRARDDEQAMLSVTPPALAPPSSVPQSTSRSATPSNASMATHASQNYDAASAYSAAISRSATPNSQVSMAVQASQNYDAAAAYAAAVAAQYEPRPARTAGPMPLASAEEEKERLYQDAVAQRPARRAPHGPVASPWAKFGNSETEKAQLYETAIKEREAYDGPYAQVTTVPYADMSETLKNVQVAQDAYDRAIAEREQYAESRGIAMPVPPPNASGSRTTPEPPSSSSQAEGSSSLRRSTTSMSAATFTDERQLYEQAIARREDSVRASRGPRLPPVPPGRSGASSSRPPPVPPEHSRPLSPSQEGIDEKKQLARYMAAQDQMAAHQRQMSYDSEAAAPVQRFGSPEAYNYPVNPATARLARQPSITSSESSGSLAYEPRDPAIALGKRRADPPYATPPLQQHQASLTEMVSSAGYESGRRGTGDVRMSPDYEGVERMPTYRSPKF